MSEGEGGGRGSSDRLSDLVSSHALSGRARSGSLSTPPAPPADFNPPVDASPAVVEATIHGIATPPTSGTASPASAIVSPPPDHPTSPSSAIPYRPAIQALQRVSQDSYSSQPSSLSVASSATSEGADHLAEMRDRLIEEGSQIGSAPPSRDGSSESIPTGPEIKVVQPTPPMKPRTYQVESNAEAGPSRPRMQTLGSSNTSESELPVEHAWDSVWPSPAVLARRSSIAPDMGNTRFPIAPVSPFVTPSFSPAVLAASASASSSRRPPSPGRRSPPGRPRSPHRFSPVMGNSPVLEAQPQVPEMGFPKGRRRSITAAVEFGAYSPPGSGSFVMSKHARSFSNSSATSPTHRSFVSPKERSRIKKTPPPSPPRSPRRSLSSLPERPPSAAAKGLWRKHTAPERTRFGDIDKSPPVAPLGMRPHSSRGSSSSPSFNPARSPTALTAQSLRVPQEQSSTPGDDAVRLDTAAAAAPIPPVDLPPPVATSASIPCDPEPPALGQDSGMPSLHFMSTQSDTHVPLFQPLARPANLRRSLSDFDPKVRGSSSGKISPDLPRAATAVPALKSLPKDSLKRTGGSANLPSPTESGEGDEADLSRTRKSPRLDPSVEPMSNLSQSGDEGMGISFDMLQQGLHRIASEGSTSSAIAPAQQPGDFGLVDEGDILPPEMDFSVEVTFEDEGLNTLERIFLLSKSDFGFHRAYIARVLGDLLYDVDPCESVEYVLPLISSFTIDEDETVKEAFAAELHRILWYFFSTCEIAESGTEPSVDFPAMEDDAEEQPDEDEPMNTVTVTSEGLQVVERPSADELAHLPELRVHSPEKDAMEPEDADLQSATGGNAIEDTCWSEAGPSTMASDATTTDSSKAPTISSGLSVRGQDEPDTPDTAYSADTAYSPAAFVDPFSDDMDPEKGLTRNVGPLAGLPRIPVDFFTPLLGAMLLNSNPNIQESVRTGIVSLIGRIRGKGEITTERWGSIGQQDPDERRTFASQTGPHSHDVRPMSQHKRDIVEHELLQGIVVGIGHLSTDVPEDLFGPQDTLDDANRTLDAYAEAHGLPSASSESAVSLSSETQREKEAFQAQILAEATAGRATSVNLIGSLCEFYDGQAAVERGFVDEVLRCGDGEMATRAEGAVAMSLIAKIAPVEHIYRMIPLFEQLAADEVSQVRQSTTLAIAPLAKRIESQDYRRTFAVKAFRTLVAQPDEVRCAALEILGELIYVFHDDERGPPVELVQWYMDEDDIGRILDADWEVVASFNFPGIALTLGSKRWDEIRDLYARLNTTTNIKVLRTLAASLHELAKILEPEQVATDLMPVYLRCITESDEIRELIYEHVDDFLRNLPLELGWQTFLALDLAWEENRLGGWRARERLALHIPVFFEIFDEKEGANPNKVLRMMKDALLDPFAAVRDAATKGIPTSYTVLGKCSDIARRFHQTLLDLAVSPVFRRRLTFVRCLREFVKPPPNRSAFEEFFLPALPALSTDVVDVRLGLAQTIADLFVVGAFYGDRVKVPQQILNLAQQLAHDKAADVRDTVRNVDLKRLHKGEGVPHEIKANEAPDRASIPAELQPAREASRDSAPHKDGQVKEGEKPALDIDSVDQIAKMITDPVSESGTKSESPAGLNALPLGSSPQGVSPSSSSPQADLSRRPSTEALTRLSVMRLNSSSAPLASPALRTDQLYSPMSGLGTLGSPGPSVMRPGFTRGNSALRTPGGGFADGHWYSTPSPTRVPGGMDPFEASFVAATPSVSSASEAGSIEDGIMSP